MTWEMFFYVPTPTLWDNPSPNTQNQTQRLITISAKLGRFCSIKGWGVGRCLAGQMVFVFRKYMQIILTFFSNPNSNRHDNVSPEYRAVNSRPDDTC